MLLVLGGASVTYLLRSRTFDRKSLWQAGKILTLWAITAVAIVAVLFPNQLFCGSQ